MKKILVIIFLAFIDRSSFGQQFTDLYGDYLGQTPPGDTPIVFAPGIISRNTLEHCAAIFSADGNKAYWASRENQESMLRIWLMLRINNRWTKPEIFEPRGDSVHHFDPFLSVDGKRLYFGADKNGNADIWFVEEQGNNWSKPQNIGSAINNINGQCQASFTKNGTVYYLDYKTVEGKWTCDIIRSKFINGNYLQPDTLPPSINSSAQDWTPYIAPDESYLIFSSNRQNELGDLYISFHDTQNETWTEAINLGEPINTKSYESFPSVSPDGMYLFFTRYNGEENSMDVFWVSAKIIDRLREKANRK